MFAFNLPEDNISWLAMYICSYICNMGTHNLPDMCALILRLVVLEHLAYISDRSLIPMLQLAISYKLLIYNKV